MPLGIPDLTGTEAANGLAGYINNRVKAVGKENAFTPAWTGITGITSNFGHWFDLGDMIYIQAVASWTSIPTVASTITLAPPSGLTIASATYAMLNGYLVPGGSDNTPRILFGQVISASAIQARALRPSDGALAGNIPSTMNLTFDSGGTLRLGGLLRKAGS